VRLLPWPSRAERKRRITDARASAEASRRDAAEAENTGHDLLALARAMREHDYLADLVAGSLRRRDNPP